MPKFMWFDDQAPPPPQRVYVPVPQARRYGCLGFLFDIFLTLCTGGLWLIWIFVREMRRR